MCDAVSAVPAGKPVTFTVTSNVAAVIVPDESLVRLNVSVDVPDPPASVPVTGGTSLDGSSAAVKLDAEAGDGVGVVAPLSSHAAAPRPSAIRANTGM